MELTIEQIKAKTRENITFVGDNLMHLDLIIYPKIMDSGDKNLLYFVLYYTELEVQNKIIKGWSSKTHIKLSCLICLIMDVTNQYLYTLEFKILINYLVPDLSQLCLELQTKQAKR